MKIWSKGRSYFYRVLTITISVFLLLCLIFFTVTYTRSKAAAEEAYSRLEIERNAELLRQADIYFDQFVKVGSAFFNLSLPYSDLQSNENYEQRSIFNTMMQSHINANPFIAGIDIAMTGNSIFPSVVNHEKHLGALYFYDIYTATEPKWPFYFDLVTKRDVVSSKIALSVNGYLLSDYLFAYRNTERQEYLFSSDGVILLTNQKSNFFKNIDDIFPDINWNKDESSEQELTTYGDNYYIICKSDKYNYYVLSLFPKAMYAAQNRTVLSQSALITCCFLLVSIVSALFLSVRFYNPVKKTVRLLQMYIPEDIQNYENEIEYIHKSIAKYSAKRSSADAISGKLFSDIQNAHAAALQYQINSHFLFNTLENIKGISISELGIENEVENSIALLNTIIREGLYQKNIIVSLEHEILLAKCYLELMTLRFPDVSVVWDIKTSVLSCPTVKFTLQPILENCFMHGFLNYHKLPKSIHIQIETKQNQTIIRIQDNGIGMTEETILELTKQFNSVDTIKASSHVGLLNVHQRIVDIYGNQSGVYLIPSKNGSLVEIRYPSFPATSESGQNQVHP